MIAGGGGVVAMRQPPAPSDGVVAAAGGADLGKPAFGGGGDRLEMILVEVSGEATGPQVERPAAWLFVAGLVLFVVQLTAAQLGRVGGSRVAGGAAYAACVLCVWVALVWGTGGGWEAEATGTRLGGMHPVGWLVVVALAGGLQGGFLMTMLLGHAYLTEGARMTQAPFAPADAWSWRGCWGFGAALSGGMGLWPYLAGRPADGAFGTTRVRKRLRRHGVGGDDDHRSLRGGDRRACGVRVHDPRLRAAAGQPGRRRGSYTSRR